MALTLDPVAVGEVVWRAIAPWKRIKRAQNKRRARLGKPLLPITEEDEKMLPQGTMTKTGIVVMIVGPLVGMALHAAGIGDCSPEEVAAATCQGAEQLQNDIVNGISLLFTAGGAILGWVGKTRAAHREQALKNQVAVLSAKPVE